MRAIFEMMKEFQITVFGCGCAIATKEPERKRIEMNFVSTAAKFCDDILGKEF